MRKLYDDLSFWCGMANVAVFMAVSRAIPPFLALVAAGAFFRWIGWWS